MSENLFRIEEPIAHRFTWTYSQPKEYHFCKESVIAPQMIAADLQKLCSQSGRFVSTIRVLDVCAGTGIVGFEMTAYLPQLKQIDFLEVQSEYEAYFQTNKEITGNTSEGFCFLNLNYQELQDARYAAQYDVIVSNPPYFLKEEGVPSKSILKNRSRFFIDATPEALWLGILNALKPGGLAYILSKSGKEHGRDRLSEIRRTLGIQAEVKLHANIRGTDLIKIIKLR